MGAGGGYAVAEGGDGDDPRVGTRSCGGEEEGFEEVEEEEVGEVVGAELRFVAVGGISLGGCHDAVIGVRMIDVRRTVEKWTYPALKIATFNLSVNCLISAAAFLTLSNDALSMSTSVILPLDGVLRSISSTTALPLSMLRTVPITWAPVAYMALKVSIPMPEETPVIRNTLSVRLLVRPSSSTIWRAVGRASPGPLSVAWAAA